MPRFFSGQIDGDHGVISGEDARHIVKSLRMQLGEQLTLCDGEGTDYLCAIREAAADQVLLQVLERTPCRSEPATFIRLYQALPKGDKLDFIVQKATELGVSEIVPVLTSRCISRPDDRSMGKKLARLSKIAAEAAKQSGRGIIPQVLPLMRYEPALESMSAFSQAILFYEGSERPLSDILAQREARVAVFVGCEGGFSPEEAGAAAGCGIALASLGPRILRCETAPVCALSALLYAYGEM